MFSSVFVFQVFPLFKVREKFQEKYRKNQRTGSFGKSQSGARGEQGVAQAATWRGHPLGRASGAPGAPGPPLAAPLRLFIPRDAENPRREPFSRSLLCSAAAVLPRSGATEDLFPAPCRREESPQGASSPPWMLPR